MPRTGLLGGTFDPIHLGHLLLAEQARDAFHLEQVVFVPAGEPPHKPGEVVTGAEHRYLMAQLAIAGNPCFALSRVEIDRGGASFSIDTLGSFLESGYHPDELFFIAGADAILDLLTWRRHQEAIELCTFLAAERPGYDLARMAEVLPSHYLQRIRTFPVLPVGISATGVRERVRSGRSVRYMVPEAVESYIRTHGLYAQPEQENGVGV